MATEQEMRAYLREIAASRPQLLRPICRGLADAIGWELPRSTQNLAHLRRGMRKLADGELEVVAAIYAAITESLAAICQQFGNVKI